MAKTQILTTPNFTPSFFGHTGPVGPKVEHDHHDDYEFEKDYWGDCCNTFDEDQKHYVYAKLMGLERDHYSFNVHGARILDIGGGPSSMLLQTKNLKAGKVVDPIAYPKWTADRYKIKNIEVQVGPGEEIDEKDWDEVWIYNCLQHAIDPEKIINLAKKSAKVLRFFEWIDIPAHDGHPHELTEANLDKWIGHKGFVTQLAEQGCYGKAYYGAFIL
jgi:hypothetical protein